MNNETKPHRSLLDLERAKAMPLDEAHAELMREYGVRERCYTRWVNEGKLARCDARDRLTRLAAAAMWLGRLSNAPEEDLAAVRDNAIDFDTGESDPVSNGEAASRSAQCSPPF